MGASDTEKEELTSYQLKDVAQTWCKILHESRALSGVSNTWEYFKTAFHRRFFPMEMREAKVEEFINLKQGSMTVREYFLKFVKLSSRDEMSRFLTRINKDLEEECRSAMLHDNMELSRLMVHVQQGTSTYFSYGKRKHMVREYPKNRGQDGGNAQTRPNPLGATAAKPPKRNKFNALKGMDEQDKSNNVVTDHDIPSIDSVLVVNEFVHVFPDDLPGVPPP
ncbi:uncharacterized protein [Solanum lycopersicum]|uniref:uncharacterized protein n=1 Tax=Solanum lycopersicum TaxID=4081 RepID=UPI0037492BED